MFGRREGLVFSETSGGFLGSIPGNFVNHHSYNHHHNQTVSIIFIIIIILAITVTAIILHVTAKPLFSKTFTFAIHGFQGSYSAVMSRWSQRSRLPLRVFITRFWREPLYHTYFQTQQNKIVKQTRLIAHERFLMHKTYTIPKLDVPITKVLEGRSILP